MATQTFPQSLLSPGITFISPSTGPISGGTQVTINGENFVNGCRVRFGGLDSPLGRAVPGFGGVVPTLGGTTAYVELTLNKTEESE